MVTVGFVVEGPSGRKLVESESFKAWSREACGLDLVPPVVDVGGKGELCSHKIIAYVEKLRTEANPDKVVVLVDLDPEQYAPCISKRKEVIGNDGIDLIVIARKAMESWFLVDTEAMRCWTGDKDFYEDSAGDSAGDALGPIKRAWSSYRAWSGSKQDPICKKVHTSSKVRCQARS